MDGSGFLILRLAIDSSIELRRPLILRDMKFTGEPFQSTLETAPLLLELNLSQHRKVVRRIKKTV